MIIIRLAGGLGNQMFQYAFGKSLADRLCAELAVDISDRTLHIYNGYELGSVFNIRTKIATKSDLLAVLGLQRYKFVRQLITKSGIDSFVGTRYMVEPHFHFAPEMLQVIDNVYLIGYWQSEKYFLDAIETIRHEFAFRNSSSEINESIVSAILNSEETAVSLHVRRGDFVNDAAVNQVHGVPLLNYYKAAMSYLAERVKHPRYYVFSDDLEWVKSNLYLPYPHVFIGHNQGEASYEDMRLMSLCQHHVIANSSFSWWGAWLNPNAEKIVVAPKKWFASLNINTQDLIPPAWIKL